MVHSLLPFVAVLAPQAAALSFTYPKPGKSDYVFSTGDHAIITWEPASLLSQVFIDCGSSATAKTNTSEVSMTNVWSPYIYNVSSTAASTYCKFCTGTDESTCSGTFEIVQAKTGAAPKIWDIYREDASGSTCGTASTTGKKNTTSTASQKTTATTAAAMKTTSSQKVAPTASSHRNGTIVPNQSSAVLSVMTISTCKPTVIYRTVTGTPTPSGTVTASIAPASSKPATVSVSANSVAIPTTSASVKPSSSATSTPIQANSASTVATEMGFLGLALVGMALFFTLLP